MKMIIFTGGTLGHIMPAIVLIKEIKKRYQDSYIVVVATSKDQDYEIFRTKDIDKIYFLNASKASFNILKQIKNLKVYHEIKNIIKEENVEIAYGFGGYISGIGMLAAKFSKLKTYLHEQNSVMGKANKILSKVFFIRNVYVYSILFSVYDRSNTKTRLLLRVFFRCKKNFKVHALV